jgi:hypothetical protein
VAGVAAAAAARVQLGRGRPSLTFASPDPIRHGPNAAAGFPDSHHPLRQWSGPMCQRLSCGGARRWLRRWIAAQAGAELVDDPPTVGGRSTDTAGPGRSLRAARVDEVETV